jgi:hypothetical protein
MIEDGTPVLVRDNSGDVYVGRLKITDSCSFAAGAILFDARVFTHEEPVYEMFELANGLFNIRNIEISPTVSMIAVLGVHVIVLCPKTQYERLMSAPARPDEHDDESQE